MGILTVAFLLTSFGSFNSKAAIFIMEGSAFEHPRERMGNRFWCLMFDSGGEGCRKSFHFEQLFGKCPVSSKL